MFESVNTSRHHALTYDCEDDYVAVCENNIRAEMQAMAQKPGTKVVLTDDNTVEYRHHLIRYETEDETQFHIHPSAPEGDWKTYDLGYVKTYLEQLKLCQRGSFPSFVLTASVSPGAYANRRTSSIMNQSQTDAIKGLRDRLELIQGPPGTGKSTTIYYMIRQRLDGQTLVTSRNNQAIASVCEKLKRHHVSVFGKARGSVSMVVLGSPLRISDACVPYHIDTLIREKIDVEPSVVAYRGKLSRLLREIVRVKRARQQMVGFARLVALKVERTLEGERKALQIRLQSAIETWTARDHKIIMKRSTVFLCTIASSWRVRRVKNIVVDEAATVDDETMLLLYNKRAVNFVLVGDHRQLPPYSEVQNFVPISFFERMIRRGHRVHMLTTQYRMAPCIGTLVSNTFYDGKLQHASRRKGVLSWHKNATPESEKNMSFKNVGEISKMCDMVNAYMRKRPDHTVLVITFYNAQRVALQKKLRDRCSVVSVDGCQGMEADAVFVSCVRSNKFKMIGFCKNERRLCVALSRAKTCLRILGNHKTFRRNELWRRVWRACGISCLDVMKNACGVVPVA